MVIDQDSFNIVFVFGDSSLHVVRLEINRIEIEVYKIVLDVIEGGQLLDCWELLGSPELIGGQCRGLTDYESYDAKL
jgi:hypothetical protein